MRNNNRAASPTAIRTVGRDVTMCSAVGTALAWPRSCWMFFESVPAAPAKLDAECRRSWNRDGGKSSFRMISTTWNLPNGRLIVPSSSRRGRPHAGIRIIPNWRREPYGPVVDNISEIGGDPLVDGMRITMRLRQDFVVTDAAAVLAAGRRAFLDLNPDADEQTAVDQVSCAADAVYALLERDGFTADHSAVGLRSGGGRQQLTFNDPQPMPDPPHCFDGHIDYFALPPSELP